MFQENPLLDQLLLAWRNTSKEDKQDLSFPVAYILVERGKKRGGSSVHREEIDNKRVKK